MNRKWYHLTDEEVKRLNCPVLDVVDESLDSVTITTTEVEGWQYVGQIPIPRNKLEWFLYDLIHGIAMRYPIHKIIGWSISCIWTRSEWKQYCFEEDLELAEQDTEEYTWVLADEELLAKDWNTPEEDNAWRDL